MTTATAERKRYEVKDFDRVRLSYFGDLIVTQGDQEALEIEADEELLEKLSVEVRGRTLRLEFGRDWLDRLVSGLLLLGRRGPRYYLTVRELHAVGISGRGSLHADALKTDELELKISGAGEIELGRLEAGELELDISGRGEFRAAGRVESQRIRISGSGEVEADKLESRTARVQISGHGNATVAVADKLEAVISGFGRIEYRGDPQVSQSISGAGSVKKLGD